MGFRIVSAAAIAAALSGLALATGAQAAVTVIGNGIAHNCYEYAEFNLDAKEGIATCSAALTTSTLTATDRAATYVNRGIMRSRVGDSEGALDDYNTGLEINGSLGEGFVDRGATLIALGRYEDALNDLNKGISLGSKRLQIAYYDRAIVQERLGNIRGAYDDYKKAVAIKPTFTLASDQLQRFRVVVHSDDNR